MGKVTKYSISEWLKRKLVRLLFLTAFLTGVPSILFAWRQLDEAQPGANQPQTRLELIKQAEESDDSANPEGSDFLDDLEIIQEQGSREQDLLPDFGLDNFQSGANSILNLAQGCYRSTCQVWAHVKRSEQKMYLYIEGKLQYVWDVSTGSKGSRTPNFDTHPDGRIYRRYSSRKFPGGDYKGLGNMPYAVFIRGGFAIHGTPQSNWSRLGSPASHGCIRLHPDNSYIFNSEVRRAGKFNTWITVSS